MVRWRRRLVALSSFVLAAGCPASQVGKVEGPGLMEEPTMGSASDDGGATGEGGVNGERAAKRPTTPVAPEDRDRDGVADADDPCPDLAEIMNGYEDDDGCPDDPPRLVVPAIDPAPMPPILFAAGSSSIAPAAYPGLDAVVQLMLGHPDVQVVELQGHVDGKERGKGLDVARAVAVRKYLVGHGVDGERLVVKGYGATRPRDPGGTDAARARNRRVELSIALRVDEPAPAPTPAP